MLVALVGVQWGLLEEGRREGATCPASAEELLPQCRDLASALRLLRADSLHMGLELLRRIQERLLAILQHSTQVGCPSWTSHAQHPERRPGWGVEESQLPGQPAGCCWTLPLNLLEFLAK